MQNFKRSILLFLAALGLATNASATTLTFDLTSHFAPYLEFFNTGAPVPQNQFTVSGAMFSFDTVTGIGTLEAKLMNADDSWVMTGIFSDVSYVNAIGGFDPAGNQDLYFDYLIQSATPPSFPFGYGEAGIPAIVFDSLDLDLTPVNIVGNQDYNGITHFVGGEMSGYDAWIYWQQWGADPDGDLSLSFWCYTDPKNSGPGKDTNPHKGPIEGSVWSCDQYWDMNPNQDPSVPEPATLALLGMGLTGIGLKRKFQK